MQVFVRTLAGTTTVANVPLNVETVDGLKSCIQGVDAPLELVDLIFEGRCLQAGRRIADYNISSGATLHMTARLLGGAPVKVKMMTTHLPCGEEVVINIEKDTPILEVKRQLEVATGVPIEHQKVMLSGIGQLTMGDKRTNLKFSHCGTANNLYFATVGATKE